MKRISWLTSAVAGMALLAACGEREVILQGERIGVRDVLEGSASNDATPVRGSAAISLPGQVNNADWAQRGGNVRHAAPHAALRAAPALAWATNIGEGSSRRNRISAAPVVAGGRAFTLDAAMVVSAVSTGGALLWQSDLTPSTDRGGRVSGGGLAAEGGRIYAATAYGEVIAMDGATGAIAWRQRVDAPVHGAPAVADGMVYVNGRNGSAWAMNASDGKVAWQVTGTPAVAGWLGSAAPTVGERSVIFPSVSGDLMAVLKIGGGNKIWQKSMAGRRPGVAYAEAQDVTGDAALVGGTLYAGTGAGRTVAMDAASGERIWSAEEGALGPMAIAGGSLFLVSDEARLARLDAASGKVIWAVALPYFDAEKVKKRKAITAHYGPVLAGGRLWVASSDGVLRGFSPQDGSLTASVEIPGGAASQPAVAGGTLYVVSNSGQLLAFR
ncbi:PQQ-like beta-propeller repeat protein [Pseudogemmobacter faecipullorum]|uniref:PQQ-binding-like beta-propeller repeat protein n=1 Tax=Pseudogemmobacter faecipullorum TaxID=2755041 RepID=A0ABS8CKQ1_9RHOB|nr:PQQ-like beta-propeller repeat protein [Pseudogemmobacter faecipullorum]MCB5409969.1 PQQ-binding-like beta-propeller repeat protein [Pseudogemmobacter faecipullorum]